MSSAEGGIFRFGTAPGYGFIFLIIVAIAVVTILIPGTVIYYVIKVPSTSTECDNNEVIPGAPITAASEIGDEEFEGW